MLTTTVGALIERVRRDTLIASRGAVYTLGSAYTAGATSVVLAETPSHIGQGSIVSIDYELFYVQTLNTGTKTLTVIPGYFSSIQSNHSQGAVVEVDPRFPKAALLDYLEHEIRSWGKQLWRVSAEDLDVLRATRTYDLSIFTGEIYGLLDVRLKPVGVLTDYWNWSWTGDGWPHLEARLLREQSAAEFASGTAIQFRLPPTKDGTARVIVAQPFDLSAFVAATDLVATVGLKPAWLDIAEYGCRYRALTTTVVGRTDWRAGNMNRNAEDVSAFDVMRATSQLQNMRDLRLAAEGVQLRGDFPYREG